MIKVLVNGALGKMGKEVVQAVLNCSDMELVGAVDIMSENQKIENIIIGNNLETEIKKTLPDIVVDFTQPNAIFENAKLCLKNKIIPVIGTTGLSDAQLEELKNIAKENNVGCFVAPNFSTGAVLMMKFAKMAAKYFNNAEIIELHHNQKKDAPSGTAIKTAQMMSEENSDFAYQNCAETETIVGARGATVKNNLHIHSIRMPGFMASQEVILGSSGQVLKIRHDSVDRKCYMPGIILAIRYMADKKEFVYGLDNIL